MKEASPGGDWHLASVYAVMPEIDTGNWKDQNEDGWVCKFSNPNKNYKHSFPFPDWVVKDNTSKLPEQPPI